MTSQRRKWALILLGVAAVVALVARFTREREPACNGKSLSEWVELHAEELDNPPNNQPAAAAINVIGTNALPWLIQMISFEPPAHGARATIGNLILKLPFVSGSSRIAQWCRYESETLQAIDASLAFAVLGTNAQSAIPQLVGLMNQLPAKSSGSRAAVALVGIGKPAIPALLHQLANTNAPNRQAVVFVLGWWPQLVTNHAVYLPALLSSLEDSDEDVRFQAVLALNRIAILDHPPEPSLVVPALTQCLNPTNGVRMWSGAARALEPYGDKARGAVPLLLRAATGTNELIRYSASNALMQIAPEVLTNAPPPH